MRIATVCLLALLAACGSSDNGSSVTGTQTFTSLALTPSTVTLSVGQTGQLTATPLDQNGHAIAGLGSATFKSSNQAIATVSALGLVTGVAAGTDTITASLTAQGVTKTATSVITVASGGTVNAAVTIGDNFYAPVSVTVSSGGTVQWTWTGVSSHTVTFDAGGPNSPIQSQGTFSRTFTAPGTYTYFCTVHGRAVMSGAVIVQ